MPRVLKRKQLRGRSPFLRPPLRAAVVIFPHHPLLHNPRRRSAAAAVEVVVEVVEVVEVVVTG